MKAEDVLRSSQSNCHLVTIPTFNYVQFELGVDKSGSRLARNPSKILTYICMSRQSSRMPLAIYDQTELTYLPQFSNAFSSVCVYVLLSISLKVPSYLSGVTRVNCYSNSHRGRLKPN